MFKAWHLIMSAFLLAGCQSEPIKPPVVTTTFSANAMTIDYRIIIGQSLTDVQRAMAESIIQQTFSEINATFNKWNPDSEISKLNRLKSNEISKISPELEQFLMKTEQIVALSDQRFDPTIEPLQQLWKDKLKQGDTPTEHEIDSIMPAIGWDKIHFANGKFYKDHDLSSLDLGGIAKGLCVDWLVERLNAVGFNHLFVEWGGEIRASGRHPNDRAWNIYISQLADTDPDHAITHVHLNDQAIATSGDYLQNWTVKEGDKLVTYFHILNPSTGKPLIATEKSIASASILAPNCSMADGIATVAMMFPSVDEAVVWLESIKAQHPSIQYWLVTRS